MVGNVALAVVCPVIVFFCWAILRLGSGLWEVRKLEQQTTVIEWVAKPRLDYDRLQRVSAN